MGAKYSVVKVLLMFYHFCCHVLCSHVLYWTRFWWDMILFLQFFLTHELKYHCWSLCMDEITSHKKNDMWFLVHAVISVILCPWWRHQMETFSTLLAIYAGNSPVPVNSPHKGQWHGALMFSLICVWINSWVNNREAGDLRCYYAHYDVIVVTNQFPIDPFTNID